MAAHFRVHHEEAVASINRVKDRADRPRPEKIIVGHQPAIFSRREMDGGVKIAVDAMIRFLAHIAQARMPACELLDNFASAVGGAAIENHDFNVIGSLRKNAVQRLTDVASAIERRDADGQLHVVHCSTNTSPTTPLLASRSMSSK